MKVYILIDENNIVRCMASEECNLHKGKLYMKKYHLEAKGTVGDEYNAETDEWTPRPENYRQPSEEDLYEIKIGEKLREIAIREIETEGEKSI